MSFAIVVVGVLLWVVVSASGLISARSGDGWRLLAIPNVDRGQAVDLRPEGQAAGSATAIAALWAAFGGTGSPEVDPQSGVLVRVTVRGSSTCRISIAGLRFDGGRLIVNTSSGIHLGCTADAIPYTFLISLRRAVLPPLPIKLVVETEISGAFDIEAIE